MCLHIVRDKNDMHQCKSKSSTTHTHTHTRHAKLQPGSQPYTHSCPTCQPLLTPSQTQTATYNQKARFTATFSQLSNPKS